MIGVPRSHQQLGGMVGPAACGNLTDSLAAIDSLLVEAEKSTAFVDDAISSLLILQNTLRLKVKALKQQRSFLEKAFAASQVNVQTQGGTVQLNLRGKIVEIDRKLLFQYWGSYFFSMILAAPNQDKFFIDRPYEGMDLIMAYMGCQGTTLSIEDLDKADYYDIDCADDDLKYYNLLPNGETVDLNSAVNDVTVSCISILPRHRSICCGTFYGLLKIIPMSTFKKPTELVGHGGAIANVLELNDGRVCSIAEDHTLRLWDLEKKCCVAVRYLTRPLYSVFEKKDPFCNHFNPKLFFELEVNRVCFAVGNAIRAWNAVDDSLETVLTPFVESQPHSHRISKAIHLYDDVVALVSLPFSDTLQVWGLMSGKCILSTIPSPHRSITALAKGGNQQLFTANDDCIRAWDVKSRRCVRSFCIGEQIPTILLASPGGKIFSFGQLRNDYSVCSVFSIESKGCSQPHSMMIYPDATIKSLIQLQDSNILLFMDGSVRSWRP